MEGKYRWMATDIYGDLPPKYRDYEKNLPKMQPPEDLLAQPVK
jgi:hypothetical protein